MNIFKVILVSALKCLMHTESASSSIRLFYCATCDFDSSLNLVFQFVQQNLARLPGLQSEMAKIKIINDVSGVIKPGRYVIKAFPWHILNLNSYANVFINKYANHLDFQFLTCRRQIFSSHCYYSASYSNLISGAISVSSIVTC